MKTEEPEEQMEIELRRPVLRNTETKLFTTPTIKLYKKGTKIRYFISCLTGAFALGLPLAEDINNMTQDVVMLRNRGGIPAIIQCGHILADSRKQRARRQNRRDCENPHPLDTGETIIVTEFAWSDNPPPYPKGVMDPAKFGNQNTTLAPQEVALNYAAADEFDEIEITGEIRPTLAGGLLVRTEPCVVIWANDHLVKRGPPRQQRNYDSLYVTVASPSFPLGTRVNDRRIMPKIKTRPKPGTLLALRLTTIEANVATQFGREMFAPKQDYPTGKLLTEHSMLVEYLTTPPNRLQQAIEGEENIWSLEPDYDEFQLNGTI